MKFAAIGAFFAAVIGNNDFADFKKISKTTICKK